MSEFLQRVNALQKDWKTFLTVKRELRRNKRRPENVNGKLTRGLRTPEHSFREPILNALCELGGSATLEDVLKNVERNMKGVLNEYDRQSLKSNPHDVRWKNTVQWTRFKLVKEGLLSRTAKRGTCEITDKGRYWLRSIKH